jgi:RNA polymerase sigma factor (sigma-70 family)
VLVANALGGSLAAWQEIVDRHQPAMHAAGRSFGIPHDDLADIVHCSWLRAFEHLGELRGPSRLRPWLLSIMRNEFHRVLRSPRRRRELLMEDSTAVDFPDETADVEEQVIREESSLELRRAVADMRRAVASLGQRERDIVSALASGRS